MYKPSDAFLTPVMLLKAEKQNLKGVQKRVWKDVGIIYVSFKTYGGTDTNVNGIYTVVDTASIETWYRPDITSQCGIRLEDGRVYEIIGAVENISMRNIFCKFKVKYVEGSA